MNFHIKKANRIIFVLMVVLTTALAVPAQTKPQSDPTTVIYDDGINKELRVATGNNLYCAGYVQNSPTFDTKLEIVGANEEKDRHVYAEGDEIYLNVGAANGVMIGDMYSVIRPRGKVNTKWTKKDNLGVYVQELGAVTVFRVMQNVSVAKVRTSCGAIMLGDLLTKIPNRESPRFVKRKPLDVYASSTGKANGKIFMARDNIELLGREQIVYIDLGREDSVNIGDYLTIYRPLGTGNIYSKVLKESIDNKEEGYESDRYKGGKFSNQAGRKKGVKGTGAVVTTEDAKSRRPEQLRRVVGELVILNVLEKTATAMIVRNATEIHTGDSVELQ